MFLSREFDSKLRGFKGELKSFSWVWDAAKSIWAALDPPPPPLGAARVVSDSESFEVVCHNHHAFLSGRARFLTETGCEFVAAEAGGWVRAVVPIESEEQACRDFLALGADIEVLEPPELRSRLAAAAWATAALYQ